MTADFTLTASQLAQRTGLQQVLKFACLGSTNVRAVELIEQGQLRTPAAILTARQTAGKGQRSNTWWSDAGTLTATFALRANPDIPAHQLPLRVGVALLETAALWVGREPLRIKWPNDLLNADHRKIAGILCQRVRDTDILGIGINLHSDLSAAPASVRSRAASLHQLCKTTRPTQQEFFLELTRAILALQRDDTWWQKFTQAHALHDKDVVIDTSDAPGQSPANLIRGRCRGIDEQGCLLIDDGATLHHLLAGTVQQWT